MNNGQVIRLVWLLAGLSLTQAGMAGEGQWFPSKYGAADTIGAANNLSPEKTLHASRLVKRGKAVSLAVDTGADTPAPPFRSYPDAHHADRGWNGYTERPVTGYRK